MIAQIKKNLQTLTPQQGVILLSIWGFGCIIFGSFLLNKSFKNKLLPNTYIDNTNVSELSIQETIILLKENQKQLEEHTFTLKIDDISLASSSSELEFEIDFETATKNAYKEQQVSNPILNTINILTSYFNKHEYFTNKKYADRKIKSFLTEFNKKIEIIGKPPEVSLKISNNPNSISVFPGSPGRSLNTEATTEKIITAIQEEEFDLTPIIASTSSVLTEQQINETVKKAENFVNKKLFFTAEDEKFTLQDNDLVSLIDPIGSYNNEKIQKIIDLWSEKIDRPAQNAVFDYDSENLNVTEFVPHKNGLNLDQNKTIESFSSWLEELKNTEDNKDNSEKTLNFELPLNITSPEMTLEKTNDLGIKERIGFGESYYYHSIPNRVHNVTITANKISATIVPPGKEFSFNKTLGEVSKSTGYRSAYVISGGKTVLGDGGGVCQVSSTLFRSVIDAGLDVSKRLQHSYRVSYYELNSQPGFDATVYSGDIDFRFINDSPNHIIIVTHVEPENRYMNIEIYGTDDGRVSEIYDYKKWGYIGPPAPEYYPTPDLPTGVTEQVDWAVSGIKTEFTNTVKDKDGNIIHDDTYYSNYKPWSAKYRIGI